MDGVTDPQVQPLDAHPSARDFVDRLTAWGFRRRRDDGVHVLYRGPHGGTLRVLRSPYGRADTGLAEKAARFVGVTPEEFWTGPPRIEDNQRPASAPPLKPAPSLSPAAPAAGTTVAGVNAGQTDAGRTALAIDPECSMSAADLFGRLFPNGVLMTAELLADLERWTQLTERLVDHARAS